MGDFTHKWMHKPHLAYFQVTGVFDIGDAITLVQGMNAYIEEGESFVHLIIDIESVEGVQFGLDKVQSVASVYTSHEQVGWILYINKSPKPILQILISMGARFTRMRHRFFTNHDEALDFLMMVDPSLRPAIKELLEKQSLQAEE